MFEFITGKIVEINPSYLILENNGIGYFINISLQTFTKLGNKKETKIFIHQIIREDSNQLYGFADKEERELFKLLLTVSGVGANTARIMLSSMTTDEIRQAIVSNDVSAIKSVKGIGTKTAQRIIVDLKDKIAAKHDEFIPLPNQNFDISEAVMALVALGFNKNTAEKTIRKLLKKQKITSLENLIKAALKELTK